MKKTNLVQKCKKIKIILTDVDGTLTDGSRYFNSRGENFKKFHVRDGMGINILLRNKIKTIIITKERSLIVKKWASSMNVSQTIMGVKNKETILSKICSKYNVTNDEVAYIGDDVNDSGLLKIVGFSATPHDGIEDLKKNCHYVCKKKSGEGAFREIADMILSVQNIK